MYCDFAALTSFWNLAFHYYISFRKRPTLRVSPNTSSLSPATATGGVRTGMSLAVPRHSPLPALRLGDETELMTPRCGELMSGCQFAEQRVVRGVFYDVFGKALLTTHPAVQFSLSTNFTA
ncbi:hypothetical protein RRG08_064655 [Elysia crispata]|uniref:Uncharacterized protein n=1 Tax=Elysia crispata TaxID=231223 RepID=A0AAE1BBA7_9GAST|nr:hypothetical protein RRG08_064655 [Elysia crispata]